MGLKYRIRTRDEVPEEQRGLYAEREGGWVLDVEGAVDKAKLDEFRTTNVALLKERDELQQRFAGIDPDEVRSLRTATTKAAEEAQLKAGEFEKVLETRTKALKGDFDKQLSSLTTERDSLQTRLASIQIDQGVVSSATKRGLRPTALPDITARARAVFRLVDGVPTAFEADGHTIRTCRDGTSPLALEEWVEGLVAEAPHLFEGNSGAGGPGGRPQGGGGAGAGRTNPFAKESWNLTEQMRLLKQDPKMAERLKRAAG